MEYIFGIIYFYMFLFILDIVFTLAPDKNKENPLNVRLLTYLPDKSELTLEIENEKKQIEITPYINGHFVDRNGREKNVTFTITGDKVDASSLTLYQYYPETLVITSTEELGVINQLNCLEFHGVNGKAFKVNTEFETIEKESQGVESHLLDEDEIRNATVKSSAKMDTGLEKSFDIRNVSKPMPFVTFVGYNLWLALGGGVVVIFVIHDFQGLYQELIYSAIYAFYTENLRLIILISFIVYLPLKYKLYCLINKDKVKLLLILFSIVDTFLLGVVIMIEFGNIINSLMSV